MSLIIVNTTLLPPCFCSSLIVMPSGIMQKCCVHLLLRQVDVAHHRPSDEACPHVEHVRVLLQLGHHNVRQPDVVELIHSVEDASDLLAVPQLHHHLLANQRLEEGTEKHLLISLELFMMTIQKVSDHLSEHTGQVLAKVRPTVVSITNSSFFFFD